VSSNQPAQHGKQASGRQIRHSKTPVRLKVGTSANFVAILCKLAGQTYTCIEVPSDLAWVKARFMQNGQSIHMGISP